MKENAGIYALAVAVVVVGTMQFTKEPVQVQVVSDSGSVEVVERTVGAFPGPDIYSNINVYGAFQQGGGSNSIDPVTGSYTLTAANMVNANVITFDASTTQAALTVTLPASTTFPIGKEAGSYRSWVVENPFTAAATTTTIAAGTGVDLQEPDGQNVVIEINDYAWITCFREASTDIVCRADETIVAD